MRPEPNNDIDLLLRQLSRRNGAPVSEIDEQHLDADELNSYVANALPAAARARYTAHLADCSSCRKLVVELSAAYGPVAVLQPSEPVVAPSGLMSFLASLFSPMVMRYAVPAVGLMVIAVIGVVVMLRQDSRRGSVAQLDEIETRPATAQPESSTFGSASPGGDVAGKTTEPQRQPVVPAAKEDAVANVAPVTKEAPPVIANQANQPADAVSAVLAEAPPPPKVAQTDDSTARADLNKEKKQEAAKTMAAADEAKERAAEADKNAPPKKESQVVTVTPGTTIRRDIAVRSAKSTESATTTAGAGVSAGQDAKRAPAAGRAQSREEAKDAEAEAEVRSVAGRRFRKSGRVWIDTAYDDSKPIMTVPRGSEQYRVLVADEPSIRRIADELDGEIVVVWKGRTYRIR